MKKNIIYIIAIICIVGFVSGFLTYLYINEVNALNDMTISVRAVTLDELRFTYSRLKVVVEFTNPSSLGLSDVSSWFDVYIANTVVGNGSFSNFDIDAKFTSSKEVYITVYHADVADAVIDAIENHNFDLTIEGTVRQKVLFDILTVTKPFTATYSY